MKKNIFLFFSIMIIYAIVDIAYQALIGLRWIASVHESAGIDVFSSEPNHPETIPVFFVLIAFALLKLVVQPAIKKRSVTQAVSNGILLGVATYGTLALVRLWSIDGYPWMAFAEIVLEGALFSPIAAGLTTWIALKKDSRY